MIYTFWIVKSSSFGPEIEFFFDDEQAALNFCLSGFSDVPPRRFRPRSDRSIHIALANAIGSKLWLKDRGLDFWPVVMPAQDFREYWYTDDDLPF